MPLTPSTLPNRQHQQHSWPAKMDGQAASAAPSSMAAGSDRPAASTTATRRGRGQRRTVALVGLGLAALCLGGPRPAQAFTHLAPQPLSAARAHGAGGRKVSRRVCGVLGGGWVNGLIVARKDCRRVPLPTYIYHPPRTTRQNSRHQPHWPPHQEAEAGTSTTTTSTGGRGKPASRRQAVVPRRSSRPPSGR